jgi:hypothetical protein
MHDVSNSRLVSLMHRLQFGIYFAFEKQNAILLGDMSGIVVHPFFIHFAHLHGCHLYQERQRKFSLLHIEEKYSRLASASLQSMNEEEDPFSTALASHYMSMLCLYSHAAQPGKYLHEKAVEIINKHDIRFVPRTVTAGTALDVVECKILEEMHERAAHLSQIIFTEVNYNFVARETLDMCSDLEKQFRNELPVCITFFLLLCMHS